MGIPIDYLVEILDTTQLAVDLHLETHKIALFSNSITPYDANERESEDLTCPTAAPGTPASPATNFSTRDGAP